MYACICARVTVTQLHAAIAAGASDIAEIGAVSGAGVDCGVCIDRIEDELEAADSGFSPNGRPFLPLIG